MNTLRRTIHPEIRVLDAKQGLVEYVASDESVDSYREVIRASGWRFTHFQKNAPFVDSHNYGSIDRLLGKVVDFAVKGTKLIETVQWAKDIAEQPLAVMGWKMVEAGFLPAVSVGFRPVKTITPHGDRNAWNQQLEQLKLKPDAEVRAIYTEQEQIELSAVIIGANPNALAKAYKADVLNDEDLNTLSRFHSRETAPSADSTDAALEARRRSREQFLDRLQKIAKHI